MDIIRTPQETVTDDDHTIYIAAPQDPELCAYHTLRVVCCELEPIVTLINDGNYDEGHKLLIQFLNHLKEKQQEMIDTYPF